MPRTRGFVVIRLIELLMGYSKLDSLNDHVTMLRLREF